LQKLGQQIADHRGHPVERQRLDLHHERIAKLIHDEARQFVRFRPNQAPRRTRRPPPDRPHERRTNPRRVQRNAIAAQPPPNDLRLAIVDPRPDETPGAIPAFDRRAVVDRGDQRLDLVAKDPGMTLHHARLDVGFQLQGGRRGNRHGKRRSRNHIASTVQTSAVVAMATIARPKSAAAQVVATGSTVATAGSAGTAGAATVFGFGFTDEDAQLCLHLHEKFPA